MISVTSSARRGYLLTQILGGIWADRFGGKLVLGLGVVWWSVATACTPIAAQMGLPALLAARALMGIGEGVAMPAMNNLLSRWVLLQIVHGTYTSLYDTEYPDATCLSSCETVLEEQLLSHGMSIIVSSCVC